MALHTVAPIPRDTAIARPPRYEGDKVQGFPTDIWADYFERWVATSNLKPTQVFPKNLVEQAASISATDLSDGGLAAGLYRLSYYARISRAATTSSSLTVQFNWTDDGVAVSQAFAAITGNTTSTQQNGTIFFRSDKNSPVTYQTTYATAGATSMQYALDISLEYVSA